MAKIAVIIANMFEDVEYSEPAAAFKKAVYRKKCQSCLERIQVSE